MNDFQKASKAGFPLDYIRNDSKVKLEIELDCYEFTYNCPATNAPDFARILITYTPNTRICETKALKLYFSKYRYKDCFNEELCNRVLLDFLYYIQPSKVQVVLAQNPRGGIANTCTATWNILDIEDKKMWRELGYVPKSNFRGGWALIKAK